MIHLEISPIAFSIFSFDVYWYGIMYILGLASAWILGRYRAKLPGSIWTIPEIEDLITWTMIGVILGGRLGYCLFYDLPAIISNPSEIFRIWHGGMSFHGGVLGVLASIFLWSLKKKRSFLASTDFITPLLPPGLFFGRIGNFINGELWGSITAQPWAVVFPNAGPEPRHPTQLYEALLEGPILFLILWIYTLKPRPVGRASALFALCYASFRFGIEFIRQPDAHIGYIAFGWLTMGQILCIPLAIAGAWVFTRKTQDAPRPQ